MKTPVVPIVAVVAISVLAVGGCTLSSRRAGLTSPSGTPGEPPGQGSAEAMAYPSAAPVDRTVAMCEAAGGVWSALLDTCRFPR
jgi:hypothetical protein